MCSCRAREQLWRELRRSANEDRPPVRLRTRSKKSFHSWYCANEEKWRRSWRENEEKEGEEGKKRRSELFLSSFSSILAIERRPSSFERSNRLSEDSSWRPRCGGEESEKLDTDLFSYEVDLPKRDRRLSPYPFPSDSLCSDIERVRRVGGQGTLPSAKKHGDVGTGRSFALTAQNTLIPPYTAAKPSICPPSATQTLGTSHLISRLSLSLTSAPFSSLSNLAAYSFSPNLNGSSGENTTDLSGAENVRRKGLGSGSEKKGEGEMPKEREGTEDGEGA